MEVRNGEEGDEQRRSCESVRENEERVRRIVRELGKWKR